MKTLFIMIASLLPTFAFGDLQQLHAEALLTKDNSVRVVFTPPSYWKGAKVQTMTIDEAVTYFRQLRVWKNGGSIVMKSNKVSQQVLRPVLQAISKNETLHFSTLDGNDIGLLLKDMSNINKGEQGGAPNP